MQLLKNPGFEDGMPNDWQTYSTGTTQIHTYPEEGRRDGYSIAIEYKIRELNKMAAWVQNIQIDHTKKHKLSGWMKIQNIIGNGAVIRVDWKDVTGRFLGTSNIMMYKSGTISWTYFEGEVIPNPGAILATIVLELYNCSGKVWFDDISFSDVIIRYRCINGQCVQDPNGLYSSLEECQRNIKYACINNQCVKVCTDYSGIKYDTLSQCQVICRQVDIQDGMYLSNLEIDSIIIRKNNYPWKKSFLDLGTKANNYLNINPVSVTDNCFDNSETSDYNNAALAGNAARDLALYYRLTGIITYANKARDFINTWFKNMTPTCITGDILAGVKIGTTFPGLFYGADLLLGSGYTGWSNTDKNLFKDWVKDFIMNAKVKSGVPGIIDDTWTWSHSFDSTVQNVENWRVALVSSAGALLKRFEDSDANMILNKAYQRFKDLIPVQIDSSPLGRMKNEYQRADGFRNAKPEAGLSYSTYAINAMIHTAEVCRHVPTNQYSNLYDYKLTDGRGLKAALIYITDKVKGHPDWPYGQCNTVRCNQGDTCNGTIITECALGRNCAIFELAYKHWPTEISFKKAICDVCGIVGNVSCTRDSNGRNMFEDRNLGFVTLTHGISFIC